MSGTDSFMINLMSKSLKERLEKVIDEIDSTAKKVGRNPADIKLVAVSKTHPINVLQEALEAGCKIFGENKVQEGVEKVETIGREKVKWHLIGHLQKNKVRKAVQNFDVIHTVDSLKLARRMERIGLEEGRRELSVLVQLNLADEESKFGIKEKDLPELVEFLKTCNCLHFDGLMIIPPFFEDIEKVRPFFSKLRKIRDSLQSEGVFASGGGELSMGMSHDFKVAIEEGATLIRVGTAIFGHRNYAGSDK